MGKILETLTLSLPGLLQYLLPIATFTFKHNKISSLSHGEIMPVALYLAVAVTNLLQ